MIEDRYKKAFLEEAFELIENTNQLILKLENDSKNESLINELFRYMHSLKSEAGLLGFNNIMEISHLLEDIFDYFRKTKKPVLKEIISVVFKALDFIHDSLNSIAATSHEIGQENSITIIESLKKLSSHLFDDKKGEIKGTKDNKVENFNTVENQKQYNNDDNDEDEVNIVNQPDIDLEKLKNLFKLTEFDIQLMESDDLNYFLINVYPIESCIMKYPRIYLVFNNLKQVGEVIKS
ncbi:MAG: Hpt domain-containing protein, partial [Exilispira sp.]